MEATLGDSSFTEVHPGYEQRTTKKAPSNVAKQRARHGRNVCEAATVLLTSRQRLWLFLSLAKLRMTG